MLQTMPQNWPKDTAAVSMNQLQDLTLPAAPPVQCFISSPLCRAWKPAPPSPCKPGHGSPHCPFPLVLPNQSLTLAGLIRSPASHTYHLTAKTLRLIMWDLPQICKAHAKMNGQPKLSQMQASVAKWKAEFQAPFSGLAHFIKAQLH